MPDKVILLTGGGLLIFVEELAILAYLNPICAVWIARFSLENAIFLTVGRLLKGTEELADMVWNSHSPFGIFRGTTAIHRVVLGHTDKSEKDAPFFSF